MLVVLILNGLTRIYRHIHQFTHPGADPDRDARVEKMIATGKYDRKAIRARIELESWMDEQLSELFGDDYDVEIDLDEVWPAPSAHLSLSLPDHCPPHLSPFGVSQQAAASTLLVISHQTSLVVGIVIHSRLWRKMRMHALC